MRQEAVSQIYGQVDGKEPPAHNIISEALRAYYTRVDRQTLNTWACQVLCMIVEYHMACMTRGSPVTSPLVPGELKERLPPLTNYAPPKDHSSVTDPGSLGHQEEISHKPSKEEISNTEMINDKERGGPEPSSPREEADVE